MFHLKLSLRIVDIYGAYKWPKFFFYPPGEIFSRLLVYINTILFPWVAGCHLIIWDVFHKTISSLFFSLLVFQQLHSSFCCKHATSRPCFPSFTPFHSYFCSGGIVMFIFSTHHLVLSKIMFLSMPIHLTGVSFPLLKFFSPYQVLHNFLTGVLSIYILRFNLEVFFRNVLCPSLLTECFRLCSPSLYSFLNLFNLSRLFGFTRLSKKQLNFTSSLSLPFSLRCHSRSRDEILS